MRFVMAEVGIQADLENANRRSFGWVAGAAVIAIVFVTVLGIDRERMLFTSKRQCNVAVADDERRKR